MHNVAEVPNRFQKDCSECIDDPKNETNLDGLSRSGSAVFERDV